MINISPVMYFLNATIKLFHTHRGLSKTLAPSEMEFFVTLANGLYLLNNVRKSSILDVAGGLLMPLGVI